MLFEQTAEILFVIIADIKGNLPDGRTGIAEKLFYGAGLEQEAEEVRGFFVKHANRMAEKGIRYPGSELNYEQTIVAPSADILLQAYQITGGGKYLEAAKIQVSVLWLFNGMQPLLPEKYGGRQMKVSLLSQTPVERPRREIISL